MKSKMTKRIAAALAVGLVTLSALPTGVAAKSLSEAFYSYAGCCDAGKTSNGVPQRQKYSAAGLSGYVGLHYVRATVGQPSWAIADTGKVWAVSSREEICWTSPQIKPFDWMWPTAYGYYGN